MFIDTNVFLRFLIGDHADHATRARSLLKKVAEGELSGWTTTQMFHELAYVLTGTVFRMDRSETRARLDALLNLQGLEISERAVLADTLATWESTAIDFPDAYHGALIKARGETSLYSFDHDFDRIPGLQRIEPPLE